MASTTPTDATQSVHTTPIQPTTIPSTSVPSTSTLPTAIQSPLLFLSNMSNLMSIKLDYTNYIPWRHQLLTILEAYSLIEHIDGTALKPSPFVLDTAGNITSVANPEFQAWKIKDKALLSLINSTLTPQVFSLVVGITSSREVWNTLEQRFTSTSRANILNLKLELQSIKKGNESVNSFLQKIKIARDKLLAVGVIVDNEELICIVLRGLPREFAHFCSAIRTRSDPISYEQLAIMLQSEEQAMTDHMDSVSHNLAMFASNGKANGSTSNQSQNHGSNRGRGRNNANRGRGGGRFNHGGNQQHFSPQASHNFSSQFQNFSPQYVSSQNFPQQSSSQGFKHERPSCQICGKSGHQALDCYHRMDFAYQGKNPSQKLAAMASVSNAAITNNQDPWLADSGTSDHLTANLNNLSVQSQYKGPDQVTVGNGQSLPINHIGNTTLHTKYHNFTLKNVLHVPRIALNLLSVHKFCLHNNCSCYFDANQIKIQDIPMGRLLYKGLSENGVYPIYSKHFKHFNKSPPHFNSESSPLKSSSSTDTSFLSSFHVNKSNKWLLWHHRLGHPSDAVLNTALSSIDHACISNVNKTFPHCKHCLSGKMHQFSFPISVFQASKPLELVHSDV